MRFEKLTALIHELSLNCRRAETYLRSVPEDIRITMIDNGYTNPYIRNFEILVATVMNQNDSLFDDVLEFLYNFNSDTGLLLSGIKIRSEEDFFNYLRTTYYDSNMDTPV